MGRGLPGSTLVFVCGDTCPTSRVRDTGELPFSILLAMRLRATSLSETEKSDVLVDVDNCGPKLVFLGWVVMTLEIDSFLLSDFGSQFETQATINRSPSN